MNTYCLVCKKYTRNINPKVMTTENNRKMMLSRSLHLFHKDRVCLIVWD